MTQRNVIPNHFLDPRLLLGDQGIVHQNFVEANVKRGTQHYIEREIQVSSGQTISAGFRTGKFPVIIKYRNITASEMVIYRAYRNSSFSGGSGPIVIENYTDENPVDVHCSYYEGVTVDVLGDLFTTYKTLQTSNQNPNPMDPFVLTGIERVLKRDSDYIIQIENPSNNTATVDIYFSFYEGPLSTNIR